MVRRRRCDAPASAGPPGVAPNDRSEQCVRSTVGSTTPVGMDFSEFEELFGELEEEPPDPDPDYRATYRARRLTVIRWFPGMTDLGPTSSFFRQRKQAGTAIADLTRYKGQLGDEISVTFRSGGRNRQSAEKAIAE